MKKIYPDLWQSEKGSHFGMSMRTYLLKTPEANIIIYYSDDKDEVEQIKELAKINYQFISHHHEFAPALFQNLQDFQSTLCVHEKAFNYLKRPVEDIVSFKQRIEHFSGIRILYTPGHTDNNICLYYKSPNGKDYLFTGDTIYLDHGDWNILVIRHEGGSYTALKESLLQLRKLNVDVIMPSVGVGAEGNKAVEVDEKQWHSIIDNLLKKISHS